MPHRHFPRTIPGDPNPTTFLVFLGMHCAMGVAAGTICAAIVVLIDLGGMKQLLVNSSEPFIPMFVLFTMFALTFGAVKMGVAIMSLPREAPDGAEDDAEYHEPPEPPQPRE
jgi:hypothetical protein